MQFLVGFEGQRSVTKLSQCPKQPISLTIWSVTSQDGPNPGWTSIDFFALFTLNLIYKKNSVAKFIYRQKSLFVQILLQQNLFYFFIFFRLQQELRTLLVSKYKLFLFFNIINLDS